jgi:hypothetical protein
MPKIASKYVATHANDDGCLQTESTAAVEYVDAVASGAAAIAVEQTNTPTKVNENKPTTILSNLQNIRISLSPITGLNHR